MCRVSQSGFGHKGSGGGGFGRGGWRCWEGGGPASPTSPGFCMSIQIAQIDGCCQPQGLYGCTVDARNTLKQPRSTSKTWSIAVEWMLPCSLVCGHDCPSRLVFSEPWLSKMLGFCSLSTCKTTSFGQLRNNFANAPNKAIGKAVPKLRLHTNWKVRCFK